VLDRPGVCNHRGPQAAGVMARTRVGVSRFR
jgi:hypothetical protein